MHSFLPRTLQTLFLHPLPKSLSSSVPHSDPSLSADHYLLLLPLLHSHHFSLPWQPREEPPSDNVWQYRPRYTILPVPSECGESSPHIQVTLRQLCCAQCTQLCPGVHILLAPSWEAPPALTEIQPKVDTLGWLVTCLHTCCSSRAHVYHSGNLSNQWICCLIPRKVFSPPWKYFLPVALV